MKYVIGFLVIALLAYGGWKVKRWWNYSWGYQSQVQKEVCNMVKPEHLTVEGKNICK